MGKRRIILTHNSKVGGFDKMLKQVFPSSIPQQYVDKLIITTNDGNISEILGEQLEGPIPLDPKDASPLSRIWNKETKTVEIYLNLKKVQDIVVTKVQEIFKNANLK